MHYSDKMEIKKKTWPEYFQKILDGDKNVEVRLADFNLNKEDILIFEEFDPKTKKYTGRVIKKKVKNLIKFKPLDSYSVDDLKKFGIYEIEMESVMNQIQGKIKPSNFAKSHQRQERGCELRKPEVSSQWQI